MPNYCSNSLKVIGRYKDVHKFLSDFHCESINTYSMANILPSSNKRVDWGTKFNVQDCQPEYPDILKKNEGLLDDYNEFIKEEIMYKTAHAPNLEFFNKISHLYPDVIFVLGYYEPGEAYVGQNTFMHGMSEENAYYELNNENIEDYYRLAIELELESADYIINEMEDERITTEFKKFLSSQYDVDIKVKEDNILDLTDLLVNKSLLPDPE